MNINPSVVETASKVLATKLLLSNDTIKSLLDVEQATDCMKYAISVVLHNASGGKPVYETVPVFLDDLVIPLATKHRGVVIETSPIEVGKRPESYDTFLTILASVGCDTGKVRKVNPGEYKKVLTMGIQTINDQEMVVGIDAEVSFEEVLLRAMLKAPKESEDRLRRIVGHMDLLYMSTDELARQWATSFSFA